MRPVGQQAAPWPVPTRPVAAGASVEPPPSARTRVVRAGESLWAIARDLLGPGAADAAVARLVEALWALNAERVPSGDPSVIPVGLELVLPELSPTNAKDDR